MKTDPPPTPYDHFGGREYRHLLRLVVLYPNFTVNLPSTKRSILLLPTKVLLSLHPPVYRFPLPKSFNLNLEINVSFIIFWQLGPSGSHVKEFWQFIYDSDQFRPRFDERGRYVRMYREREETWLERTKSFFPTHTIPCNPSSSWVLKYRYNLCPCVQW